MTLLPPFGWELSPLLEVVKCPRCLQPMERLKFSQPTPCAVCMALELTALVEAMGRMDAELEALLSKLAESTLRLRLAYLTDAGATVTPELVGTNEEATT